MNACTGSKCRKTNKYLRHFKVNWVHVNYEKYRHLDHKLLPLRNAEWYPWQLLCMFSFYNVYFVHILMCIQYANVHVLSWLIFLCQYTISGVHRCPVSTFDMYSSKLNPKIENFWQLPKSLNDVTQNLWYDNMAVGKNALGNVMAKLSKETKLSKRYTNYCIRAICITNLDENGIETRT